MSGVVVDLTAALAIATPLLSSLGAYVAIRVGLAEVRRDIATIQKSIDKLDTTREVHSSDIGKLREEVGIFRTQIVQHSHELGAIREEQMDARDFSNATRGEVTMALQKIAVLEAKAGITPTKNRT